MLSFITKRLTSNSIDTSIYTFARLRWTIRSELIQVTTSVPYLIFTHSAERNPACNFRDTWRMISVSQSFNQARTYN